MSSSVAGAIWKHHFELCDAAQQENSSWVEDVQNALLCIRNFLSSCPHHSPLVADDDESELARFSTVFSWIISRRYGWSETSTLPPSPHGSNSGACTSPAVAGGSGNGNGGNSSVDMRQKRQINADVDSALLEIRSHPITPGILRAVQLQIRDMTAPVVRQRAYLMVIDWFKQHWHRCANEASGCSSSDRKPFDLDSELEASFHTLIRNGLTDVWSATRKSIGNRLFSLSELFGGAIWGNLLKFLTESLSAIPRSEWKSIDGLMLGIYGMMKRIVVGKGETPSIGNESLDLNLYDLTLTELRRLCFVHISHSQLCVREQAVKTMSALLSRQSVESAHQALEECIAFFTAYSMEGQHFPDAYSSEGYLHLVSELVKALPDSIIKSHSGQIVDIILHLLNHDASTVRQQASSIMPFLSPAIHGGVSELLLKTIDRKGLETCLAPNNSMSMPAVTAPWQVVEGSLFVYESCLKAYLAVSNSSHPPVSGLETPIASSDRELGKNSSSSQTSTPMTKASPLPSPVHLCGPWTPPRSRSHSQHALSSTSDSLDACFRLCAFCLKPDNQWELGRMARQVLPILTLTAASLDEYTCTKWWRLLRSDDKQMRLCSALSMQSAARISSSGKAASSAPDFPLIQCLPDALDCLKKSGLVAGPPLVDAIIRILIIASKANSGSSHTSTTIYEDESEEVRSWNYLRPTACHSACSFLVRLSHMCQDGKITSALDNKKQDPSPTLSSAGAKQSMRAALKASSSLWADLCLCMPEYIILCDSITALSMVPVLSQRATATEDVQQQAPLVKAVEIALEMTASAANSESSWGTEDMESVSNLLTEALESAHATCLKIIETAGVESQLLDSVSQLEYQIASICDDGRFLGPFVKQTLNLDLSVHESMETSTTEEMAAMSNEIPRSEAVELATSSVDGIEHAEAHEISSHHPNLRVEVADCEEWSDWDDEDDDEDGELRVRACVAQLCHRIQTKGLDKKFSKLSSIVNRSVQSQSLLYICGLVKEE